MRKFTKNLLFIIFIVFIFVSTTKVFALDATENDILISIDPENPRPFSQVTINITSYAVDLNKANISWKNEGKTVLSGTGKTKYSFTTGGPNTSISFALSIIPEGDIQPLIKYFAISPSDLDILWEAMDSYTPPFYKGKALPSKEGKIKVVAYPNTSGLSQTNQKNITYTWKNNFDTVKSASGNGKSKYIFTNSELKSTEKIGVVASGPGNNFNSEGSVNINMVNPQVIFYKQSPTKGTQYQKAITNGDYLSEDEITFVAEPYYLSFKDSTSGFKYTWKINNTEIDTPKNPRELTVRPSSRGGYANVSFSLENTKKLFQIVTNNLKIEL